jgi:hypothetical protein
VRKTKAQLQAEADLDWLTADHRGRRILFGLFRSAGTLGGGGALDHASLAWREGRRSIVEPIFTELVTNKPARLTALLTENQQDPAARDRASIDPDDPDDAGQPERAGIYP